MPTQQFKMQDPYGNRYDFGDNDPTTDPWWFKLGRLAHKLYDNPPNYPNISPIGILGNAGRAAWGAGKGAGKDIGRGWNAQGPGVELPIVGPQAPPSAANNWGVQRQPAPSVQWSGPQDNNPGNPTSFGGLPQSVPLSWTDNLGMAPGTVPPYEITASQQVAQGQGSGWNSGAPMNLGWGEEPYPVANNAGGGWQAPITPPGTAAPGTAAQTAPAIPSAWSKFDPAWYQQFSQTERQLTPDTRGMTTPDQYYRDVAQAQADLAWGEKFRATYGRAPTEDDWKFRWMQGQGQTPTAGNTAWQNMAMGNPNAPYGGRAPRR